MATTENVLSTIRTKLLREKWFGGSPTESQVLVLNPAERDRPLPKHSDFYSRDFDSPFIEGLLSVPYFVPLSKSLLPKNK